MKHNITFIFMGILFCTMLAVMSYEVEAESSSPEPLRTIGPCLIAPTKSPEIIEEVIEESKEPEEIIEEEEEYKEYADDYILPEDEIFVDNEELELLAHLINGEAGANWCSDEMMYGVGSVVLNRMASDYYPDTMGEVIFQKGQYACTWDGNFDKEPCDRAYRIAKDLLINGPTMPSNVVFQAQFKQGDGVYIKIQNMYFCYLD